MEYPILIIRGGDRGSFPTKGRIFRFLLIYFEIHRRGFNREYKTQFFFLRAGSREDESSGTGSKSKVARESAGQRLLFNRRSVG